MSTTTSLTFTDATGLPSDPDTESESTLLFGAGTAAARPASGLAVGDLWALVDGTEIRLQRWDGSTWDEYTVQPSTPGSVADRIPRFVGTSGARLDNSLVGIDATGHLDPAGAGQDLGPATAWRRAFADHMVGGVDVFSSADSLDDARYVIANDGTYTLTLPTAAEGWAYVVERAGSSGLVTLAADAGDTIGGAASIDLLTGLYYIVAEDAATWHMSKIGGGDPAAATVGAIISIEDSVGGVLVDGSGAPIVFSSEKRKDAGYTFSSPGSEITIVNAGDYRISYRVSLDHTGGSSRTSAGHEIQVDTGGGFVTEADTLSYSYHRQASHGKDTAALAPRVLALGAGDKVRIFSIRLAGSAVLASLSGGSGLFIERVG